MTSHSSISDYICTLRFSDGNALRYRRCRREQRSQAFVPAFMNDPFIKKLWLREVFNVSYVSSPCGQGLSATAGKIPLIRKSWPTCPAPEVWERTMSGRIQGTIPLPGLSPVKALYSSVCELSHGRKFTVGGKRTEQYKSLSQCLKRVLVSSIYVKQHPDIHHCQGNAIRDPVKLASAWAVRVMLNCLDMQS